MKKQKTAIVFGGLSGIGSVIVQELRKRGDNCYTVSRRAITQPNHITYNLLSQDKFSFHEMVDSLVFCQRERDETKSQYALMVEATANFLNNNWHFLNESSAIVLVGSIAGRAVTVEQNGPYHATRAAIESLARYYAVSNPIRNCRVNCVIPTTVIKPENSMHFDEANAERLLIEKITPLKRMGTAKDIAHVVDFLTSEKSDFINGQSLVVDGGAGLLSPESISKLVIKTKDV
jgi:NAD(P)-dependent dehydrogenase (short-subunit alcohol dehydrogenase family)